MRNFLFKIYVHLFANKFFKKTNNFIMECGMHGLGILNYQNSKTSGENNLLDQIKKKYDPKTIFDIGANIGNYSIDIRKIFPNAAIYSFEPNPHAFKELDAKAKNLSLKAYQLGFSDTPGSFEIFDSSDGSRSAHGSLYKEVITSLHKYEVRKTKIETITIDDFLIENNIKKIDFLKIDTEGHELKILEGAKKSIKDKKIPIIQFEFNEMNIISKSSFKDFLNILPEYNFYRLLPKDVLPINIYSPLHCEIYAFQNILAIDINVDKF